MTTAQRKTKTPLEITDDKTPAETRDQHGRFTDPQQRLDIDQNRTDKDGKASLEFGYEEEEDGHASGSNRT